MVDVQAQFHTQVLPFDERLVTGGDGLWSSEQREVQAERLELITFGENSEFGELRVFFDTKTWDVSEHGLIYTDDTFEYNLRDLLEEYGFSEKAAQEVCYSEQGMQGDDFVSLDCDTTFINEFADLLKK